MSGARLQPDDTLQFAVFDYQPTPIVILSDIATIVLANKASQQLFQISATLVGQNVEALPVLWQDGPHEAFLELVTQNVGACHQSLDAEGSNSTPAVLKLQVDICKVTVTSVISARLLVTDFTSSGKFYRMLSFESIRERHVIHAESESQAELSPPSILASVLQTDSQSKSYSGARGSTATTQDHLDTRFSQFRDAVYYNSDDKAGFLLSADETFCFPSYKRDGRDVVPVEIDDIELFFQNWDVWDPEFTAKQPISEYPSLWLNRHRTKFRNRRYGLKEGAKDIVLEASGDPLYDTQSGEYIGGVVWLKTLGEYADVSAEELRATLADFQTICDRLPHLLWTLDAEGKADYFSQSWYEFTGLSEAESLGLEYQNIIDPDDMQEIRTAFAHATQTRTECHADAKYRRHDGQFIWMSVRAKPLYDKKGTLLKWYGSSTDVDNLIVERMEAERQRTQIMEMLSLAEVGLFEVNSAWHLNVLQGRMFWLEEQQVPHLLTNLDDAQCDDPPILSRRLQDVMSGIDDSAVFEEQIRSRWYKFRLVGDMENGTKAQKQKKVIGCSVDITEQRERAHLESENARLTTEASLETEKSQLKTAFLAHMSHEIRTPIAGIMGIAELLAESHVSDEQRDYISDIQISANNLLEIVNDILDLSKIEAGKFTLEKTVFDLNALLLQVKKPFVHMVRGKPLQIKFTQDQPGRCDMIGDPGRLKQIITNLVSNAVKFTPKGSIDISILTQGSKVRICVEDTGEGIDDQTMSILFKPFVQGDASTARRHGGTGLGLTISRHLAQSMGGTLILESAPTQGTKAVLTLPLGTTNTRTNSGQNGHLIAQTTSGPLSNGLSGPTTDEPSISSAGSIGPLVLIVEDNAINQKIALALVHKLGYRTAAVWNGQEALDYLRTNTNTTDKIPSLVLMDCQMPLMDGYQATRILRTDDSYLPIRGVPVVALTASAIQGDREKCSAAGMDDYLIKPVNKKLLGDMLRKWIPGSQGLW